MFLAIAILLVACFLIWMFTPNDPSDEDDDDGGWPSFT
jgi:hypothetical protein